MRVYNEQFEVGQLVIYHNKKRDECEIGKIKRLTDGGAFVCYTSGETAALTRFEDLMPITNAHHIISTELGGMADQDEVQFYVSEARKCDYCGYDTANQTYRTSNKTEEARHEE